MATTRAINDYANRCSYRIASLVSSGTSLLTLVLSRLLATDRNEGSRTTDSLCNVHDPRRIRRILTTEGVNYAITVSFIIAFAQSTYQAFFPVLLEVAAYPITVIDLLLSLRSFVSMIVRPLTPTTIRVLSGRHRTLVIMVLLVAGGMALVAVNQSLPVLILASLLIGTGFGISPPLSMVVVVDRVQEFEKGLALGVRLTGNRLAQFISPLTLGLLAEAIGLGRMFLTGALLVGVSMFLTNDLGHDIEDKGEAH